MATYLRTRFQLSGFPLIVPQMPRNIWHSGFWETYFIRSQGSVFTP